MRGVEQLETIGRRLPELGQRDAAVEIVICRGDRLRHVEKCVASRALEAGAIVAPAARTAFLRRLVLGSGRWPGVLARILDLTWISGATSHS